MPNSVVPYEQDEECDATPQKDGRWKECCASIFGLTVSMQLFMVVIYLRYITFKHT